ncbi:elongation of very long chain fatty acids protein AAEL008004 isoform X2 [Camponotus floridanus]|uniref:elongation of very long chain fatty acids protein AAEL008004 isoform X2 n=1 Tax=Camponotus floridanus TaxID=104421 RepID=UPI000DC6AA4D|nr:elongation of very long chain fatty acids protein AAEL008004 isoform X2 [Camponotus floridanus]
MEQVYNNSFINSFESQIREWPLISSPFPLMFIISGYLYFVLYGGPRYMKNRPPYKLKTFILLYDLIQILVNLWFVKEHIAFGWFSKYNIICLQLPTPDSSNTYRIWNTLWWLFLLKIFDLVETCIFVLRKKQNQVSNLHVHHHVSNLIFCWIYFQYFLEERVTFLSLLNCAVHVIMYTYYLSSAQIGPKYQSILHFLKPFITKIQMIQFFVMTAYLLQILNPACELRLKLSLSLNVITSVFIGNLLLYLYLFYDFHKNNYTNTPKGKNN